MKIPTHLTTAIAIVAALFVASPLVAETKVAKSKVLIDFTVQDVERNGGEITELKKYSWASDSWKNKLVYVNNRGLLIDFVTSGGNFLGDKDMKLADYGFFEVSVVIGNRNKADSFSIVLTDSDGTEAQWNLPLAGKPRGVSLTYRLDLAKCDLVKTPGSTPGLNKAKIKHWQVAGNWQPPEIEVLLQRFVAAP
jgi:hypothetical protein